MTYLGVIGGSSFLQSQIFSQGHWTVATMTTQYGELKYFVECKEHIVFVHRHAADPKFEYIPPHAINQKAIIWGLKQLGCTHILALASAGTMNESIPLGSVVVPNDFLCLDRVNFYDDYRGHNVPGFDEDFRQKVLQTLTAAKIDHIADASYFQSSGPRFQTVSEIKLFSSVCDLVGMTIAHEAVLAREIALPFVAICLVHNLANGLEQTSSSCEHFEHCVADNLHKIDQLLSPLLTTFAPKAGHRIADPRTVVDKIVRARWVLPMTTDSPAQRGERVLDHHSIAVHANGDILAVLPHAVIESQYTSSNIVDLSQTHAVLPGFINCHSHLGATLLRGFGDDLDLHHWLNQYIWPTEGKFVSPEFVSAGALLAIVELVKSGTTCINDMYFLPRCLKDVLLKTGFRGIVGVPVFDVPNEEAGASMLAENRKAIDDYASETKTAIAKHPADIKANKKYDLVTHTIAPHAPYTCTESTLSKCLALAKEKNLPIHVHLHETLKEVEDSIHLRRDSTACHRSDNAISPIENFAKLGFFDHKIICAHMTIIQEGPQWDLVIANKENVKIAHCPCSNMKLASGFCPTPALISAGVDVGLGTDSAGSNNSLDMCTELKMAALIAKGHSGNPKVLPAYTALQMATSSAAKVVHLDHKIGTLQASKKADFIAINLSNVPSLPLYDVVSQIVYSTTRDMVEYVWINGEEIVKNKIIHSGLEAEAKKQARYWNAILKEFKDGLETEAASHGVESPTPT